jgi:hypothetical protein
LERLRRRPLSDKSSSCLTLWGGVGSWAGGIAVLERDRETGVF